MKGTCPYGAKDCTRCQDEEARILEALSAPPRPNMNPTAGGINGREAVLETAS